MSEHRVLALTGASAGIGAALALRAARLGFRVVASGRNAEALRRLEERVAGEGGVLVAHVGDVREGTTSTAIARLARERFGRLDVLVANAGVAGRGPLLLQTDAELAEQLETHVTAPLTLVRACLPLLSVTRGTVFVLGSGVARMPIGGMGLYPASKAALRSAARTLRGELGPLRVGLTYVDPGAVDTDFMRRRDMPGAPRALLTSPVTVAEKILRAIDRRPTELNVVPWQTALLGLAEHFPKLVDFTLRRAGGVTGAPIARLTPSSADAAAERLRDTVTASAGSLAPSGPESGVDDHLQKAPPAPSATSEDAVTTVLAPLADRMRRQNLSLESVRARIVSGQAFTEDEFALEWVGMPNKNERKLITDLCRACAEGGLLVEIGEKNWVGTRRA